MQKLFARVRETLAEAYDVRQIVGTGGMAAVFEAWDRQQERSVAIKVLKPALADGVPLERFRREVALASKLRHPNIVPILEDGQKNGLVYCVMPFVNGETLRQRLTRVRHIPAPEAIQFAIEIADALQCAHEQGIMHRDIKPENILLSQGRALVADFGIARAMLDDGANLTVTGSAIGTPHYMSPEQAHGAPIDARTDLYSLGCVLYEMLAGVRPFADRPNPFTRGPDARAPLVSTRSSQQIPSIIDELIGRALEWNADARFASAADMRDALLKAQDITGKPARPSKSPSVARGWAVLGVAAGAVVVFGLLISRILVPAPPHPTPIAVEPTRFDGPPRDRSAAETFSRAATLALGHSVGITLLEDSTSAGGGPDYRVRWSFVVDTTQTPPVVHITAELLSASGSSVFWKAPTVRTSLDPEDLSAAADRSAQALATVVRREGRHVPP